MSDHKKPPTEHRKLQLRGEPYVETSWESPNLVFGIFAGNPQITVWSKHPAEENKTDKRTGKPMWNIPIKANTSIVYMRAILTELSELIGGSEPKVYVVRCLTVPRDPVTNEPVKGKRVTQSKIIYGRNPEGFLFIEVRQEGRPVLPFLIKPDGWHERETEDGEAENAAKASDFVAKGFLPQLIDTYSQTFGDSWDPDFVPKYTEKK